jgi:prepilin signal peptidase PulO-like enzyme (type II secretory pathway)
VRYCPYCANPITAAVAAWPNNTHSAGFVVIAVLLSLLWFKVNNVPVFPLGLVGGILLAYWSHDVDTRLGKQSLLAPAVVLCLVATVIGLFLR